MNKQDKIKKVMREFKDGKLKTPNGEVVTDKKQALAIAMSESKDYAEKADLIEDISISSLSHAEDVIKSIGSEELFEKAVYADTAENRKLGRVGQEYHRGKGTKKEDKKTNKNSWGYEIKPEYSNHMSKIISKKFGKYLDGEDDSMEFVDSYWKSVANGADEKALQNSLKHAIHDRVSPGSKDADDAFKEAMANIKHYEKESQKHYKIKSNTEVKKAVDDEMGISDAHRELFGDDLEKAHQDGDMHPNGKWVWVSSANGGKGDWRTLNGRAHKKHADTQASNKFLENFKNASDDVLNKIVSGKIQAVDRERKLAQQILDSRKKSTTQPQPQSKNIGDLSHNYDKDTNETWYEGNVNNKRVRVLQEKVGNNNWWNVEVDGNKLKDADGKSMSFSSAKEAADEGVSEAKKPTQKKLSTKQNAQLKKLIDDGYGMSNSQYKDISKMSISVTPKGNWALYYDGKSVLTLSPTKMGLDRKTLEAAGIKFDDPKKRPVGAGTNGPTPKTKADKKVDNKQTKFTTKDYELWGHESSSTVKGYGLFNPDTNLAAVVRKDRYTGEFEVEIKKQNKKHVAGPVVETKSFPSRAEAMKYGIKRVQEKSDSFKNEKFEVKNADRYDKGTGQVGDYSAPTHQRYSAQNLYQRLKNNRFFGFSMGLDENAMMKKLKEHDGDVKISYSKNGGNLDIYRIEFVNK